MRSKVFLQSRHHRQDYVFAPVAGRDLNADRQTDATLFRPPSGALGQVPARRPLALFARLEVEPVEAMLLLLSSLHTYPDVLALYIASVLRPESRSAPETIRASRASVPPMR